MTWSTDLTRELASGTYEITVVGGLGPVLRAALQPLVTTTAGHCTTLRTALRHRGDVADLLAVLDAKGLEVTHVSVRPTAPRRGRRHGQTVPPSGDGVHPARVTRAPTQPRALERWPSTRR